MEKNGFLEILRDYHRENVVFESTSRGRRDRVVSVDDQGASIERADGGETSRVTLAGLESLLQELRARGGSIPLDEIPGDRVRGATFAQARRLAVSADRSLLVDVEEDEAATQHFSEALKSLRVAVVDGRPRLYKPVIVEVVLEAMASGELQENRITFDWLVPRFRAKMAARGQEGTEQAAAYAFANLAGDLFWLLGYRKGMPPLDTTSPSPAQIRERVTHAKLKDRLWDLCRDASHRSMLFDSLRSKWFDGGEAPVDASGPDGLRDDLEKVLGEYAEARQEPFGRSHPMWGLFDSLQNKVEDSSGLKKRPHLGVKASVGQGNWAKVPWLAVLAEGRGITIQNGVYCVFLFREDMSGVYLTFNQGVTQLKKDHGVRGAREILRKRAEGLEEYCGPLDARGFKRGEGIDLKVSSGLGKDYEASTVAYKLYPRGAVPDDGELYSDLEALMQAYEEYLAADEEPVVVINKGDDDPVMDPETKDFELLSAVKSVSAYISQRGFTYEPWHVAQYITAVRTKPFVILAGVTGTGKSKLPALVAEATGSEAVLIPVRPDWTDSSDVLGYVDLQGDFRPGSVLNVIHSAVDESDKSWICIVDEMNLARVEQYFAEILSRMEDRSPAPDGGFRSGKLVDLKLSEADAEWGALHLPPNLTLVGTVNMDESAHTFSRKVLDRAFTIELSDVTLSRWKGEGGQDLKPHTWPTKAWHPRAIRLSELKDVTQAERSSIEEVISVLEEINTILQQAQLQVGYRTRDEIGLFVLHAEPIMEAFRTEDGESVDPLDLALQMKVLPRISGGSNAIRGTVASLLSWAVSKDQSGSQADPETSLSLWREAGRPAALGGATYPRTAARLCLMWERLESEGFTSFWL